MHFLGSSDFRSSGIAAGDRVLLCLWHNFSRIYVSLILEEQLLHILASIFIFRWSRQRAYPEKKRAIQARTDGTNCRATKKQETVTRSYWTNNNSN